MWVIEYLAREYKKRLYITVRHLILMSAVVAASIVLASVMPSLYFHHSAAFIYGDFDAVFNGPISEEKFNLLMSSPAVKKAIPVSRGWGAAGYKNKRLSDIDILRYEKASDLGYTWFSDELLINGRKPKQGEVALTWDLAHALKLKPGNKIILELRIHDKIYKQSGFVAGIYAPTRESSKLAAAPFTEETRQATKLNTGGILYSDIFIKTSDKEELINLVSSKEFFREGALIERENELKNAENYINKIINPFMRTGATYIAIATYLFFVLREQWARLEKRRKNIAIFIALGIRNRQLIILNMIEQIFIGVITTLGGYWGGKYLMQDIWGQYLPAQITNQLITIIFILNILVLVLSIIQIKIKTKYLPVSKLLATE